MKEIVGSTLEEDRLIRETQKAIGALANGVIGTDTMSCLAEKVNAGGFPYVLTMYSLPTCISKNIIPFSPKTGVKYFDCCMTGSFTYPRAITPCSFLVNNGNYIHNYACHAWKGFSESVLYKLKDGTVGMVRAQFMGEMPENVDVAVGGMGLLDFYDPDAEGFIDDDYRVRYKDAHTVLGYKNGHFYGICFPSHSSNQVNKICKEKFCLEYAVMLDGGGLYAYNFRHLTKNVNEQQGYAIQFV